MLGLGPIHIILLLAVVLLLFGSGRVSNLMGDVAKGIKSFKKGMAEDDQAPSPPARLSDERPLDARPVPPPAPAETPPPADHDRRA